MTTQFHNGRPDHGEKDPRLDWVSAHDPRSRDYAFYAMPRTLAPIKARMWKPGVILNQGQEGACTGFGWTAELLAEPFACPTTIYDNAQTFAKGLYNRARAIDAAQGWHFSSGATVISAAKAVMERGFIKSYRWAFSIEEIRDAIINEGPVVIGIPWHEGMYQTRPSGLVEVTGRKVGGHCVLLTGYHPNMRIAGEDWSKRFEVFRWVNSWGTGYGKSGTGLIRAGDLDHLLHGVGEACVPMHRGNVKI